MTGRVRSGLVRWAAGHVRSAHKDWTLARLAFHAAGGTPLGQDATVYLNRTRARLDRWERAHAFLSGTYRGTR